MQRTRLNTLVEVTQTKFNETFSNPWRRISLSLISVLLGFFVGQAVSITAGQQTYWDITVGIFLLIFTEGISRITYSRSKKEGRSLSLDILNLFKIGVTYSLYVEALKLGS
ncbi:DUF565 domain-containing protein [Crocosphaera watsonii WH 8501]|uniref:DUF565 domain-containing protein n=3 Tax=Crocosphaera watsonii TaxID=263511 RepID=Q4C9N1_CROWT|nr:MULTISPECIES: DUF565 domain-containing protein [Crocosphaera]EAM53255.1 Protein of unknown function DUF565 [Crocosphaera watsonii WH 8501]NQZ63719.1 DUF565 domain-containing protein [Crocosphaera sp.]CCQ51754.1 FIG00571365: hypothetical protein [Crocosphaera watsonii WH 8502]CCQ59610.1 hypothetical protein CWATWH0401_3670 [Crocosphaera watsonii WH 0401]